MIEEDIGFGIRITKKMITQCRSMVKQIRAVRKRRAQQKMHMKKVFSELKHAVRSRMNRIRKDKKVKKQLGVVHKQLVHRFKPVVHVRERYYQGENYIHMNAIIRIHMNRKEHVKLFRALKEHLKEKKMKRRMAKNVAKEAKKVYKSKRKNGLDFPNVNFWRVSWNKDLYNYKGIIQSFKNGKEDTIKQSKGMAKMKQLPKIGDYVYVSCNKLKIMKCKIISDFMIDDAEKSDVNNKGINRIHTYNDTYLKMKIVEVYDEPVIFKGCQRTWTRI